VKQLLNDFCNIFVSALWCDKFENLNAKYSKPLNCLVNSIGWFLNIWEVCDVANFENLSAWCSNSLNCLVNSIGWFLNIWEVCDVANFENLSAWCSNSLNCLVNEWQRWILNVFLKKIESHLWCDKFEKLNIDYSKSLFHKWWRHILKRKINGFCDVIDLESWMQNVENIWIFC